MLSVIFSVFLSAFSNDASPWPYHHISKSEGLSNSAINSIYMDRRQYVWFGTWDGLNRYDGTTLKIYKPDPLLDGRISNNVIRNIIEDRLGNLWVVTHKGINLYDYNHDTFKTYFTDLEGLPFQEYNTRVALGPDSLVWVNVIGKGISRYNAADGTFQNVNIAGLSPDWLASVSGMATAGEMVYLLHSSGELATVINGKTVFRKSVTDESGARSHYFFHSHGTTYLVVAPARSASITIFNLANLDVAPKVLLLNKSAVSTISANKEQDALWIGTETGDIYRLDFNENAIAIKNMVEYFPEFARSQRKILSMTETDQDILWVGTDGDGVFKFLTKPKPFRTITSGENGATISNSIVRSVYEGKNGTLYVGTRSGGLNIISHDRKTRKVINVPDGLSNSTVLSIGKDKSGNIWLGTDGEGIDMLEAGTNRILHFPRDFANKTDVSFGHVYDVCVDVYGNIWLGTSGYGVIQLKVSKVNDQYRLDTYHQITYSQTQDKHAINSNVVYAIVEEMPNILWFGTRGAGAYRYNTITHQVEEHLYTGTTNRKRLSNDDILSMYVGRDALWLGTSGGLNKVTLQRPSYQTTHYTEYDGLTNNTIHGMLEDNDGMMWLSTNNGLVLFDPRKISFKTFDSNDGLQNNEFTDGASFKSENENKLYFGGINGLDVVYPDQIDTTVYFPRLAVSQFQVHNIIITPSDSSNILAQHVDVTPEIELAYDQNFISFHFTTLDYWNKQRTEYAYYLENFDKDWNHIGSQNVVNLTNIPTGEYTLQINYKKNGVWNPSPKRMRIIVNPPFWQTTWAYLFYTVAFIGIQIGIILYIRDRARTKRAAAINAFKMQQMAELNDHKLRFFTNVAHEFRTPLTLILGPVSTLIKKTTALWEKNQLRTIYSNSIRMQKLIDELLQFRKIESGKENLKVSETELVSFTQAIVDTFAQHAADHEVHLEFIPQADTIVGWVDKRKLEKVLINLISNGIKYNVKGGTVDVLLGILDGKAIYTIRDSGIGIEKEKQAQIFEVFYNNPQREAMVHDTSTGIGLSLTKSLVQMHRGNIEIESVKGKGTVFFVEIPIAQAEYDLTLHDSNNLVLLHPTNLEEKVSQEFNRSFDADGVVALEPSLQKNLVNNILIVDDNEQIVILLRNILADKYRTMSASSGEKALAILEEEKVDLVISDIVMPEMDGLTLCGKIKNNIQTSHIPVILLTAKAEIEDRIVGLQVGADSYIPKPFHPEHLFTRIEKLIENREQARKRFANLATVELDDISTGMGEKEDQFFNKITQCILEHLSNTEFTADDIAREVGLSKASLYKKVKALTNLTPHGLIKQYRLKKAADLLRSSSMSVSEVIDQTGFNSRSYFYKSFNEMFQCHPKDFGSKAG
ncbi:MAG TPA: two-component regulator propeller domain-containing protein [Chryseosolibacter sp.]|nr:two-component regulator propeller domain-containing protein [Chryseosolibacter sp.]